jgi:hypothetical protein
VSVIRQPPSAAWQCGDTAVVVHRLSPLPNREVREVREGSLHRQATGWSSLATYGASSVGSLGSVRLYRRTLSETQVIGNLEESGKVVPIIRQSLRYPEPRLNAVMRKIGMTGSELGRCQYQMGSWAPRRMWLSGKDWYILRQLRDGAS